MSLFSKPTDPNFKELEKKKIVRGVRGKNLAKSLFSLEKSAQIK